MPLNSSHLQDLRKSGLSDESIEASGIYSASAIEIKEILGFDSNNSEGIVFPYKSLINSKDIFKRVKLDDPPLIGGKPAKYLSPKGAQNRLYVPRKETEALRDSSIPLYITEGEKKALKASQEGLCCIAVSGVWCWKGKGSNGLSLPIPDLDRITWEERLVYIVYDSDADQNESVMNAEKELAKELTSRGAKVLAIRLPGQNDEKVGLDDFLVSHSTTEFLQLPQHNPLDEDIPAKRESQGTKLVKLASNLNLFHDENKEAFVYIDNEAIPLKSRKIRQWLSHQLYKSENRTPNSDSLNQALITLEAKAVFDGPQNILYNRIAKAEGAFWYDMGNGTSVRITKDGWEIVDAPILFRRYTHQQTQVEPKANGDPFRLLDFLNVSEKSKLLILVCLISYFIPDIAHPIMHPHGPHGSGKTTFFKIIKRLCDPSSIDALITPRDTNQLIQILSHHHLCLFDNLSGITGQMSDILSQACTGGGFSKRQLYTDDDDIIYQVKRCIGINGINLLINRADLMDRSILVYLERIDPSQRAEESALWEKYIQELPGILGGVFDTLSKAMSIYPTVEFTSLPRMADFAKWGFAIAQALGNYGDDFLKSYEENIFKQNDEVIQGNTLAQAVLAFMKDKDTWDGTIKEAWTKLNNIADPNKTDKTFPKSDRTLRKQLERVKSNLQDNGINYEIGARKESGYPIYFQKDPNFSSFASGSSAIREKSDYKPEPSLHQNSQTSINLEINTGSEPPDKKENVDPVLNERKYPASWDAI